MQTMTPESVGLSAQRLERIGRMMQRYVDAGKLAGVSALVARHGEVAYAYRCGMLDIATARPLQFDTLFRIYSMTKPITSTAVLMLYEEGAFQLSDSISRFIPAFKQVRVGLDLAAPEREITIWHLLTHTSGLSYGFDETLIDRMYREAEMLRLDESPAAKMERLAALPLVHQPGTAWNYSMGTDVLGYLVQVVSGMTFRDFLRERIFAPLGMEDTDFYVPLEKQARLATVYGRTDAGELAPMSAEDDPRDDWRTMSRAPQFCSGGGGLISSLGDYLRFAQMLCNRGVLNGERILGRKTVEWMTLNHLPETMHPFADPARGFGLGVGVLTDVARSQACGSLGTYGWGGAANTDFWLDPQEDLIGLLMLQFMPSGSYPIDREFRSLAYQALL